MAVKAPATSVYLWHGTDSQGRPLTGELLSLIHI